MTDDANDTNPFARTDAADAADAADERIQTEADVPAMLRELRLPTTLRLVDGELLAAGGMGTVNAVTDHALGRRMAKKSIQPLFRDNARMLRMFLREARTTGQLDHPNIVPVYDLGDRDGEIYFTMKLVRGHTLKDVIRLLPSRFETHSSQGTRELFNLIDVVVKVCDALAFAHSRGVVHCDVKSANVMVGSFGQVYLMDWGIARPLGSNLPSLSEMVPPMDESKSLAETDATGDAVLGTAAYMSPEQALGKRAWLDARADVFSTGAILYEIITRVTPYRADSREATLALAREAKYCKPSEATGDYVAPELERIVCKAMAKERSDRYADNDELKEDLVRFMRGGAEFPQTTFPKGTTIVREDEPGNAAYIIASGLCEVQKRNESGASTVMTTLGDGEVFGEMAILSEGPRTATVIAKEDTTVFVVTRTVLERELGTLKPWLSRLIQALASRMRDIYTQKRITISGAANAHRIANQVLMHAKVWGQPGSTGSLILNWPLVARELEAQMGSPPHAIHLALTLYPEMHLSENVLTISDPEKLQDRLRSQLHL